MTGTLINVGAILLGTGLGLLFKKGLPARLQDSLMKTMGLAILCIGLSGMLGAMATVKDGAVSFDGGLLLLVSLVVGVVAGELLDIDRRLGGLGQLIENRLKIQIKRNPTAAETRLLRDSLIPNSLPCSASEPKLLIRVI